LTDTGTRVVAIAWGTLGIPIAMASFAFTDRPALALIADAEVSVSSEGGGFAPKLMHAESGSATATIK
jgi:hypothetical protein